MIIFWKLKGLMLRMDMIGVDESDNKPEHEDASHDNVDDFNEDTCEVCLYDVCLLYTSPSPRDRTRSRMPSSA